MWLFYFVVLREALWNKREQIARVVEACLKPMSRPPEPVPRKLQHQKRLSNSDIASQIIAGYLSGETIRALAAQFGVHRTTVAQHVAKAGIHRQERRISVEQIERAVSLYGQGHSLVSIGAELGFNAGTIQTHLRRAGVVMRDPHDRVRPAAHVLTDKTSARPSKSKTELTI